MADWVDAAAASLMPLVEVIRAHVFAAGGIHADGTSVPVLAKERTRTGRLWAYVRDDRPFAGPAPPAAAFSPDRGGQHPERHLAGFAGIMQADAYAGFNRLYEPGRQPGPILEAACWAHARRKLYELAAVAKAPIASEAVQRTDRLFAIEHDIVGLAPEMRLAGRTERSAPILNKLERWLRNTIRPHSALGYPPPAPEVTLRAPTAWPAAQLGPAAPITLRLALRPTLN